MPRRIPSVPVRLSKRINENTSDILNLQSQVSNIITDSFCVIGGSTIIGEDDEENPIYGTGKALGYSYDGITYYASPTPNILTYIRNIDFNGYQWVATGGSQNGTDSLVLSSDGINWTTPVNNIIPYEIISIAWGKKKWVAIGYPDTEYGIKVAYSYDGMNWVEVTYTTIGFPSSVASNGSKFVIAAEKCIGYSNDGITWSETDVRSTFGSNVFVNGVVWGGNIWVVTYSNVGSGLGYSSDGISWTAANTTIFGGSRCSGVVYNGTLFLVWSSGNNILASSKDGINWTRVTISLPNVIAIEDITWNGKYWIIVGNANDLIENKVIYSSDLVTWYNSTSGNALYNQVQDMGGITSRNRKNYYLMLF